MNKNDGFLIGRFVVCSMFIVHINLLSIQNDQQEKICECIQI